MTEPIDKIVIGQYADYLNTGLWRLKDGQCLAPDDVTVEQIKDFLLISGGAVYLNRERKLAWTPPAISKREWTPGAACS